MEDIREKEERDRERSRRRRGGAHSEEGGSENAGYTGTDNSAYIRAEGLCSPAFYNGKDDEGGESF